MKRIHYKFAHSATLPPKDCANLMNVTINEKENSNGKIIQKNQNTFLNLLLISLLLVVMVRLSALVALLILLRLFLSPRRNTPRDIADSTPDAKRFLMVTELLQIVFVYQIQKSTQLFFQVFNYL